MVQVSSVFEPNNPALRKTYNSYEIPRLLTLQCMTILIYRLLTRDVVVMYGLTTVITVRGAELSTRTAQQEGEKKRSNVTNFCSSERLLTSPRSPGEMAAELGTAPENLSVLQCRLSPLCCDASQEGKHPTNHWNSKSTCWLKAVFPPGMGRLEGATCSRSRGEPGFALLLSFVE